VKDNLPVLDEYSNKVAKVHGGGNPDLLVLRNLFIDLTQELTPHLRKEELILFPYISRMAKYMVSDDEGQMPSFAFANGPIGVMEAEHEVAGEIIHKMQKITDNFNPPDQACNTWRVLYAKLNEFAEDLFEHIHLENNVLFPAAIKMENELLDSKTA
jgi:regulator of cell morphogenesis and NO signaling